MEVNFDDFVDPGYQTVPGPVLAIETATTTPEPAPASALLQTARPTRPKRKAKGGAKYTTAQKKEMEQAATIEHYMTVFTSLFLLSPAAAGIYCFLGGSWVSITQGILCFSVSGLLGLVCIKRVSPDPKQVGLRTWWGKRIPYLKQEGYVLIIPYVWDLIRRDVTDKNTDLSQDKVMTKDGVVRVSASVTWHVDYTNPFSVIRYVDAGGLDHVEDIFDDPVEEGIRIHAISETSEEAQHDKKGFRNQIIDSVGETEDKDYLTTFKNGGKHLVLGTVGIEIIQLTVPDVMLPDGAIKRKLEISNEKYDTEKENLENVHNIEVMQKLQGQARLDPKDAAEFLLISQGKLPKTTHEERINVSGLERGSDPLGLVTPFQLLGRSLSRSGQGGQGDKEKKGGKKTS